MFDFCLIQEVVNCFDVVECLCQQVRQFFFDYLDIVIEDVYVIQCVWVECKIVDGCVFKGYKIGLILCVMQVLLNISELDYGVLFDDMFFEEGSDIFFQCFIVLWVEVELVFIFGKLLKGLGCILFDVFEVIEWVILVLEIIDVCIQQVDL